MQETWCPKDCSWPAKEGKKLKMKSNKNGISARNKKRNKQKHTGENKVEKVENKSDNRPKMPKNKIERYRPKKMTENELNIARKNILDMFNKTKKTVDGNEGNNNG
jgi:hypothetical protein